jgi:glucosylceramidase
VQLITLKLFLLSLDDTAGDFGIAHLSLARDERKLIPYIRAAMAVNPTLKLWGSR